jgi:hypothetical protein
VLDKAEDGQLWVTYTRGRQVYVTHSLASDREWTKPFPLPIEQAGELTPDDISAVVAYDGAIGVMWSDQSDGAMYFASHRDGDDDQTWQFSTAIQGPSLADDHMNLKALHDDPAGRIFAVVKTSLNDAPGVEPDRPLIMLLVLRDDGTWEQHIVGRVVDDQTRPLLMIDVEHRQLIVFTSGPCCSGGQINFKSTSLDDIAFTRGVGTPFMDVGPKGRINNPTSTRQNLGSDTDLLVMASDDESNRYSHNVIYLRGPAVAPPTTSTPVGPLTPVAPGQSAGATRVLVGDDFESGDSTWSTTDVGGDGIVRPNVQKVALMPGEVTCGPRAKGSTASAASGSPRRFQASVSGSTFAWRPKARWWERTHPPFLRCQGAAGHGLPPESRSDRLGRVRERHEPTTARSSPDRARLEVRLSPAPNGATLSVRMDGQLVYQNVVPFEVGAVRDIQIGNDSKGQPFDLFVDNVKVQG